MIEKMKKFTFLVTNGEYDSFFSSIRKLGVVHVQQLQQGASSPGLQAAMDKEQRYRAALLATEIAAKSYKNIDIPQSVDFGDAPEEVLEAAERLQTEELSLRHMMDAKEKDVQALEPWGEFDPSALERLTSETGLKVYFFRCGSKYFCKEWADEYFATPVSEQSKSTYFITFSVEKPDIQAEQIMLPSTTLGQARADLKLLRQTLDSKRAQVLYINAKMRDTLKAGQAKAQNEIQLNQVRLSDQLVAGDSLRLMVGWVRADKTEALVRYLDEAKVFYEMEDPVYDDDVPIQLVNGSYSRLFEPILKMYSLPSYHDIDPCVFFAPFFMLFFGLCLGDGGYGTLVLIGGLLIARFGNDSIKDYGKLGAWLGLMTVFCGLLTGTVFGLDLTQQNWAILAPVKPYFINDNGIGPIFGYSPMMVISVFLGLAQVLLAMVLKACKAYKNFGWKYAVCPFSWFFGLVAAIALFGLPACGVELPLALSYVLTGVVALCVVGILLYNNPSSYKRPVLGVLSNVGGGLWETYGMATGLFGDLLSYTRLFALGLTGGVLGGVFNTLAYEFTSSMEWYVRWIPMVLILLAGHSITFALSMISAFVHPMRLTFVEFFKNADYEGGGKEYNPFKEIK